jgi:gliding motility-associated-like protein
MGRFLEDNDTVIYVLHTGFGNQLGTVLDSSSFEVGVFNLQMNYTPGEVHYISAVVGDLAGGAWVDLSDPCLAVAAGQPVLWIETPVADAGPDETTCRLTYNLAAASSVGEGQWSVIPDTGNVSFSQATDFSTEVTVGAAGTYTFRWQLMNGSCEDENEVDITFLEPLDYTIEYECNATATEYRAIIIVSGGTGAYSEPSNLGQFSNDTLTTDWVDAGELLQIRIEDSSICDPLDIDVLTECICRTAIGSMNTNDVLTGCPEDCLDASGYYDSTGEFLDGNDTSAFVLHNSSDTVLGSDILGQSPDGVFCYTDYENDIVPGDTLYIAYIVGDELSNGQVSLSDDCLKVSRGIPIVFFESPQAEAGPATVICGLTGTLNAESPASGSGTWSYLDGPSTNVNILNPNQPNSGVEVETYGLHRWIWTLSSNGCSSADTVDIEFVSSPRIDSNTLEIECNSDGTNYQVTFTILGGEMSSLFVEGSPGTLTGRNFSSEPIPDGEDYEFIIFDANACDSFTLNGSFDCDCITSIGTLEGDSLHLCEDQSIGTQFSYNPAGENRDGNDELRFVLLSEDESRIQESTDINFSFDAGNMNLGETYYVRAYLGSVVGGTFQYDEACTQFDGDIPVTWWAEPEAVISPSADQLSCSVTTIDLDGTGSSGMRLSYQWSTQNGQIDSNSDSSAIRISAEGTYVLLVRDSLSGCADSVSVDIAISSDLPTVEIAAPNQLSCRDTLVVLDASASTSGADIEYQWSTMDGSILGPTDESTTEVNAPGEYTLTVINTDSGCEAMRTVSVEENREPPIVEIQTPDTLGCQTPEVELSGMGSATGPDITYQWTAISGTISGDPTLRDIQLDEAGVYQLIVTNQENGCQDSMQVEVVRAENELGQLDITTESPICFGESTGAITLSTDGGAEPIQYGLIGVDENETGQFEGLEAGTYEIELIDANGCIERATVTLPEGEDVRVDLGPTIRIDRGDSATVEAIIVNGQGPFSYTWDTDSIPFECLRPDCSIIRFLPDMELTAISVWAASDLDCRASDEVSIVLRDQLQIFIPNVFSPNGDGINDVFLPEGGPDVEEIEQMQIFDRWGNMLFESRNFQPGEESAGWTGRKNGELQSPGVYVYHIEVQFTNGQRKALHGSVTLVR